MRTDCHLHVSRRCLLVAPAGTISALSAGVLLAACQTTAQSETGLGSRAGGQAGTTDLKKIAASLQTKTQALIDALNAKNEANIAKAKADLSKEVDQDEDAVRNQTGPTANRINSAMNDIRQGILSNDASKLDHAKTLLQQAQEAS